MNNEKATRHIEQLIQGIRKELPEAHYAWTIEDDQMIPFSGSVSDVYDLLNKEIITDKFKRNGIVALTTSGWAAPAEWDGAPSECPDRRRVRMTMVITMDGCQSVARFDDSEETIYAGVDEASGPLDDAANAIIARARGQNN